MLKNIVAMISDADIIDNAAIYTDGGQLSNDPPPLCKCLHVTDTLGLYGHIKTVDGDILQNRIRQSIPDDPDSCPESMYVDLDDSIVTISSVGQTPVILCEKSIYRLDGNFTSTGDGLLEAQEIESTVGCISMNSVVQVQRGVVFAGETGFYFTDGYEVRKISSGFNKTYGELVLTAQQRERIYGTFDRNDKRVWWAVQEDSDSGSDVNKYFILDTRYGLGVPGDDLENRSPCFTTASNGSYFRPTASIFKNGFLLRGDTRGYTFEHKDEYTSDPLIDVSKAASLWDIKTIIWDFISTATSFGTTLKRKFVPRITLSAENETDLTVKINSINDIGKQIKGVKPIRFRKNWLWGDPTKVWGTENDIWNFSGMIEEQRRFHSQSLRCSYKQIQLTNAYDVIITSDDLTTVTINTGVKTATLDDIATYDWPEDSVGYYIYFESDNYVEGYEITGRSDDVLTFFDPSSKSIAGSQNFPFKDILRVRN